MKKKIIKLILLIVLVICTIASLKNVAYTYDVGDTFTVTSYNYYSYLDVPAVGSYGEVYCAAKGTNSYTSYIKLKSKIVEGDPTYSADRLEYITNYVEEDSTIPGYDKKGWTAAKQMALWVSISGKTTTSIGKDMARYGAENYYLYIKWNYMYNYNTSDKNKNAVAKAAWKILVDSEDYEIKKKSANPPIIKKTGENEDVKTEVVNGVQRVGTIQITNASSFYTIKELLINGEPCSWQYAGESTIRTGVPDADKDFYIVLEENFAGKIKLTLKYQYSDYSSTELYRATSSASQPFIFVKRQGKKTTEGETTLDLEAIGLEYKIRVRKYQKDTGNQVVSSKTPVSGIDPTNNSKTGSFSAWINGVKFSKNAELNFPNTITDTILPGETKTIIIEENEAPEGYELMERIAILVKCVEKNGEPKVEITLNEGHANTKKYINSGQLVLDKSDYHENEKYSWDYTIKLYDEPANPYTLRIRKYGIDDPYTEENTDAKEYKGGEFFISINGKDYGNYEAYAFPNTILSTIADGGEQTIYIKERKAPNGSGLGILDSTIILKATKDKNSSKVKLELDTTDDFTRFCVNEGLVILDSKENQLPEGLNESHRYERQNPGNKYSGTNIVSTQGFPCFDYTLRIIDPTNSKIDLNILKKDANTADYLDGAEFKVKFEDNLYICTTQLVDSEENNSKELKTIIMTEDRLNTNIYLTEEGTKIMTISEITTPKGYTSPKGTLEVELTIKKVEGKLQIAGTSIKNNLYYETVTGKKDLASVSFKKAEWKESSDKTDINDLGDCTLNISINNGTFKEGNYSINLNKIDLEDNSALQGAKFRVKVNGKDYGLYETNSKGTFDSEINIPTTSTGTDTIVITEEVAPNNYKKLKGSLTLQVTKIADASSWTYAAKEVKKTSDFTDDEGKTIESTIQYNLNTKIISLKVKNEKDIEPSNYIIEFEKRDDIFGKLMNATFKVSLNSGTAETISTKNGKLSIQAESLKGSDDTITITETATSDSSKYKLLESPITLTIKKKKIQENNKRYWIADKVIISGKGIENETISFSHALESNKMIARISKTPTIYNEAILKPSEYSINLNKADSRDGRSLNNAVFTIKITDNNSKENSSKVILNKDFTSDANGIITISGIEVNSAGTQIIEIVEKTAPTYYEKLEGTLKLEVTKKPDEATWSYIATEAKIINDFNEVKEENKAKIEIKKSNNAISVGTLTIKNVRKTIKLSGYVWEDEKQGKEATLNGKKDSNEKLLKDVKVYLHVDGKAVYSEKLWETTTNNNGHYEFEVPMGASYYVEFKYNGYNYQHTKYTKYTGTASPITSNATETESTRDSFNNRLAEIGPNTTISNVKVSNKDNELSATELGTNDIYAISAYVGGYGEQNITKFNDTAENINLGITKRETADLALRKDVYKATISIKGKTQTYTYNRNNKEKDSNGNSYWDISVRRSDSQYYSNYTREIKEADYNYDGTDRLEVQVTYKIVVRNQSGVVNTKVTELVEYYDNDYTLEKVETDKGEKINVSNTSKYSHNTTIASYQKKYLQIDKELTPGQDLILYATFSVKTDNSGKIKLDSDSGKGNMVEIMGYSTYYGSQAKSPNYGNTEDTYTEYKEGEVVGRIDVDSNPGNAASMAEKDFEDDTDRAPYISFKLDENKRTTSGIVWEDARTNEVEKAMVGNGIREEGESGVSGVKVQLMDLDTGTIAKIWNNGWQNAETTTGEDGKYTIAGFVPGNYYIQFIYPDGQNYKSTTFNYTEVCKDFNVDNPDNLGTYCETTTNYSDARDIYGSTTMEQSRLYVNSLLDDQTSQTLEEYKDKDKSMKAITGKFEVTIEKGGNNIQGLSGSEVREYKMENIDFGLQERPKAQLMLTKEVKNVKVVLANGNILFDASGQATNVLWIRKTGHNYGYENNMMKVPSVRENAQRIQLTMDEELMHGATIKITYGIVVQNIGEVDYASKKFYYSGVRAGSEAPIKTTIKQIIDYPGAVGGDGSADNNSTRGNLQYNASENEDWKVASAQELIDSGLVKITLDGENITENVLRNYKTILTYTYNSNNELLPAIYNADEVGSKTEEVTLTLSQVMTTESGSDELAYKNIAEIVKVSNGAARTMEYSTPGNQNPDEEIAEVDADVAQAVTILPPFGQTYIYYILGGVVAIIAIGGITLIKIKVLKNKK